MLFENMDSGACLPAFKPQPRHCLAAWTSCPTSLCLGFLVFKRRIIEYLLSGWLQGLNWFTHVKCLE